MSTLDLPPYVGQRSATFRFGLINIVTGEILDDLNPLSTPAAEVSHDTSRTIKRQLTMSLGVDDTARVDIVQHRVLPFMVIDGTEYPLGQYRFSDSTQLVFTQGSISSVILLDEMSRVDQPIESAVTPATHIGYIGITSLMRKILNPLGVDYDIESTNITTSSTWQIGTNRGGVLEDLSLEGGFFSPWFNNDGRLQFILAFDPADALIDFDWDENQVVHRDSITKTNDLLSAPNRFIVISNSTNSETQSSVSMVGVYDVPDSAPWSIANRGFVVPQIVERSVDSPLLAQLLASTIGKRQLVFERYELTTAPDPRHDSYDVIMWQGERWLELAWTLTCKEGEPMRHVLRKAFR
jgi:hypothetical protein